MRWPTPQDYNEAVQNPATAFTDQDLRTGQPELTPPPLCLPRPISGGFACVYKIKSGGRLWAARCFLTEVMDQQKRYEAISKQLVKAQLPYTVPFSYFPNGIKVQGTPYPLLKMEWVQGESLSSFVGRNLRNREILRGLADKWFKMVAALKAAGISHGDLQHGNVLVVGGELRLIDYDGMFVPALAGSMSRECGHRNYQHPARTEFDYGPGLDNFSSWVVAISLAALCVHPDLWQKHKGGDECLIFRREDFTHPSASQVFRDLERTPNDELRSLVHLFTSLLNFGPLDIPDLDGSQTNIIVAISTSPAKALPTDGWWEDHVKGTRGDQDPSTTPSEADDTAKDLGWIFDSQSAAIPGLTFQSLSKTPRFLLIGSAGLLASIILLVGVPTEALAVAAPGIAGLNILICFIRYRRDPNVAEFLKFQKASHSLLEEAKEHNARVKSLVSQREKTRAKLESTENAAKLSKSRLQTSLQSGITQYRIKLDSALQPIEKRKRDAVQRETNELNGLQRTIGDQVAAAGRRLASALQKETDEKNNALKTLQKAHVQTYLSRFKIADARIPQIGDARKGALARRGITTAADIEYWHVRSASGIGHSRATDLVSWRQRLEAGARGKVPTSLSWNEITAIESKFASEKLSAQSAKTKLESQLSTQAAAVRQKYSALRKAILDEEQSLRNVTTTEIKQIQSVHDAEVTMLDRQLAENRRQLAAVLNDLSDKIRVAQKKAFALQWQCTKQTEQKRKFASLRFRDFLKASLWPY